MRLWHKSLIPYLPRQQLLSQWRECCCIARNIYKNGTPNHILVNKIMEYPEDDFNYYAFLVCAEMRKRGYNSNPENFFQWRRKNSMTLFDRGFSSVFAGWHNKRYLDQCVYNLQEKYDRGGISEDEWKILEDGYSRLKQTSF